MLIKVAIGTSMHFDTSVFMCFPTGCPTELHAHATPCLLVSLDRRASQKQDDGTFFSRHLQVVSIELCPQLVLNGCTTSKYFFVFDRHVSGTVA
jgi:hypothetical protein